MSSTPLAVVTGGGGFVGQALVRRLLAEGARVRAVSRRIYPEIAALGVECMVADLSDPAADLATAVRGADVVFHTAAKVEMWGPYDQFYRTNVQGTERLLKACQNEAVKVFIFTSSPSVVASSGDLEGVDESTPYPESYEAYYPQTKAEAERMVLAANSTAGVKTLALRPHPIWGPGDTNLTPTVLERAKAGRLVRIGAGDNLVDFTYIDDCVSAHIDGWRALQNGTAPGGSAYFISQGEPVKLWDWVNQVLALNNVAPVTRSVPRWAARLLAQLCEWFCTVHARHPEPLLSKFLVSQMATHHYFNIDKARRELNFNPAWSVEAGLQATFPQSKTYP